MTDVQPFASLLLLVAGVGLVAVLSNRLVDYVRVPAPAVFLAGAALAVTLVPALHAPREITVQRLVTVALVIILFDGGMNIGWRRFSAARGPIMLLGVLGTFLTIAAVALLAHVALGLGWYLSVLLATAVSPTDPAVVFSVLGRRELTGLSRVILEGESGANDPVGIAVMASLVGAGNLSLHATGHSAGEFLLEMTLGALLGVIGGAALLAFMRRVSLPSDALHPLRTLACAFVLYGAVTVVHGSGFLAVFVAGIAVGDARAPHKREVRRFHAALASLGEIVAFVALGLTVDLPGLTRLNVWLPAVVIALALAVVIRPVVVALCLLPARSARTEVAFVAFAGLKGAVPILLASYLLTADLADSRRLYEIVVVVVAISVVVQGSLVPAAARLLRLEADPAAATARSA